MEITNTNMLLITNIIRVTHSDATTMVSNTGGDITINNYRRDTTISNIKVTSGTYSIDLDSFEFYIGDLSLPATENTISATISNCGDGEMTGFTTLRIEGDLTLKHSFDFTGTFEATGEFTVSGGTYAMSDLSNYTITGQ